ncbi:MAG TPA: glycosyltransferase family 4 protein [Opitutaceae bacterium]|nr:glycosyltransferase family 4 protein [Opitutaceae bacterium]
MTTKAHNPVYFVTHEFFPHRGGIATFTEEMARATTALGFDIEVWAQANRSDAERQWSFPVKRLPLKGTHDLACQLKLARHMIRHRRDLRKATVYIPEPGPMLTMMMLQWARAFRPKRLLLTFHGSEILKFAASPTARPLTRKLIQSADLVSTLTNYTQRLLLEHFPEARGKAVLTPGALRTDLEISSIGDRGGRGDKCIVLTVGRIHPRKGQDIVIDALKALPSHVRDRTEYWIVGVGKGNGYESRLRATAANSGLTVRFFGDVTNRELGRIYDQADIFAMTSVDHGMSVEGFGLVYLEAAAHGLPVVAHRVGGVPEAVVDNHTGILVPPMNIPSLTLALKRLITNPSLRRTFGENGSEWARRSCWMKSAESLFAPQASLAAMAAA